MKYSFIIPTLNEEKLLEPLLKHLIEKLAAIKNDYEIIISDGGSRDKTIEIAEKYTERIIKKTDDKKENIAIGRNKGGFEARGNILIFINADIWLDKPESLVLLAEKYIEKGSYKALTFKVKIFPAEEKLRDKIVHSFLNTYFRLLNNYGPGMGRGECQVVKKDVFTKLNGYNETLAAGEDMDFYVRIKKLGDIRFCEEYTVYESPRRYRQQGYAKTLSRWAFNAVFTIFSRKAVSKQWEEVR